jgi:hypothetical protein
MLRELNPYARTQTERDCGQDQETKVKLRRRQSGDAIHTHERPDNAHELHEWLCKILSFHGIAL